MVDDYSVIWDDVKMRLENELQRRGISGADKIPMGVIEVALKKVWSDLCNELNTTLSEDSINDSD